MLGVLAEEVRGKQGRSSGLWKTADALLGRGRTPASSAIDVEVFSQFFAEKIAKVRSNTSDALPPMYSRARPGVSLRHLSPLTIDDIIDAVRSLPDNSSTADPIPTSVLKQTVDLLAPFIVELFNKSFTWATSPLHLRRRSSLRL